MTVSEGKREIHSGLTSSLSSLLLAEPRCQVNLPLDASISVRHVFCMKDWNSWIPVWDASWLPLSRESRTSLKIAHD